MSEDAPRQLVAASGHAMLPVAKLLAGPLIAIATYLALSAFVSSADDPTALSAEGRAVASLLVWMAAWWLTEAIPLPATALIPLVALPMTGAVSLEDASFPYASRVIFLFMGGFMLALAMQKWNLHRRIALVALLFFGDAPSRMIAGFMVISAVLSMWVSNTATTVMMLPIAVSVVGLVERRVGGDQFRFATGLMLGIAYSASIGGLATPIGSPPNAILIGYLRDSFDYEISFFTWMTIALPLTALFLPIAWLLLTHVIYRPGFDHIPSGRAHIRESLRELGPLSRGELTVMSVFTLTVLAWLSRGFVANIDGPVGGFVGRRIDDSTIAMAAAIALFVIPVDLRTREFTLDWETAKGLPWGVLILFGGGLSIAGAVKSSGLDAFIGGSVSALGSAPTLLVVAVATALVVLLTEMTSNTATATIFVSILTGVALGLGVDPLLFIVPAALAASCSFMMPVATPPNAIVYGSGRVSIRQMVRAGACMHIFSIALILLITYTVATEILNIDHAGVPDWAHTESSTP